MQIFVSSPGRIDILIRFADQALVSVGNFVVALLLARLLGPTQFGLYSLLWTVVILALGCHWALITAPLQKILPHTVMAGRHELFGALLVHAIFLGVLTAVAALVVLNLGPDTLAAPLTVPSVSIAMLLVVVQEFARRWLLATERPRLALISDVFRHVGTLFLLLGINMMGEKMSITLSMCAIAISSLIALMLLRYDVAKIQIRIASVLEYALRHITIGRWLLPSVMLQSLSASAPLYMLGGRVGVAAAGGYRAALNLLSPVVSLTEALETFLPLRSSQALLKGGRSALRKKLLQWAIPLGLGCVVFTVGVWMMGSSMLVLVFGEAYRNYAPVLLPLAIAMQTQFLTYILNVRLRTLGLSRAIFVSDVLSTACLVALLVLLPLDTVGATAAWALAVAQAVKLISLTVANTLISAAPAETA